MHYFINFKNYAYAELNLFSRLTLLIGKNGSGKSNLIEGVELLALLAEGRPLHELIESRSYANVSYQVRGGIHSCAKLGSNFFTLGFNGAIPFLGKEFEGFDYSISIDVSGVPRVINECLIVGDRMLFQAQAEQDRTDGMLNVIFDNFARGGTKPRKTLYGDRSVLCRYDELTSGSSAGDKTKKLKAVNLVHAIKKYVQASYVFDPSPRMMRDYARLGQSILAKDGSNISAVLSYLSQREESQKNALDNILNIVKQVPEEPFTEFKFIKTQQHDVMFMLAIGEKRMVDARLVSDGTLRVMAVVTALESVPEGSRVIIEEFDNGLHPSRAELLLSSIREIVDRRGLNVLMSTHNPASLNSLDDAWMRNVYVCYWSPEEETSKVDSLLSIPKIDYLLESKNGLGDLVTKSVFEKHLRPQFAEEHKKEAMEWLESLR